MTKSRLTSWGASVRRYEEKSERENEYHAKCVMLCGAPVREVTANNWIRQCYLLSLFPLICPKNTFYSCITQYIVAETYNSCLLCLVHDSRLPTGRSRILSHSAVERDLVNPGLSVSPLRNHTDSIVWKRPSVIRLTDSQK